MIRSGRLVVCVDISGSWARDQRLICSGKQTAYPTACFDGFTVKQGGAKPVDAPTAVCW